VWYSVDMVARRSDGDKDSNPEKVDSIDVTSGPRDVIVDAYTAPLLRKLKSRHLQMVCLFFPVKRFPKTLKKLESFRESIVLLSAQ